MKRRRDIFIWTQERGTGPLPPDVPRHPRDLRGRVDVSESAWSSPVTHPFSPRGWARLGSAAGGGAGAPRGTEDGVRRLPTRRPRPVPITLVSLRAHGHPPAAPHLPRSRHAASPGVRTLRGGRDASDGPYGKGPVPEAAVGPALPGLRWLTPEDDGPCAPRCNGRLRVAVSDIHVGSPSHRIHDSKSRSYGVWCSSLVERTRTWDGKGRHRPVTTRSIGWRDGEPKERMWPLIHGRGTPTGLRSTQNTQRDTFPNPSRTVSQSRRTFHN